MRQRTQRDLIRRLERDRPAVVVFTSNGTLRRASSSWTVSQTRCATTTSAATSWTPMSPSRNRTGSSSCNVAPRRCGEVTGCTSGHRLLRLGLRTQFLRTCPGRIGSRAVAPVTRGQTWARLGGEAAGAPRRIFLARGRDGEAASREPLRTLGSGRRRRSPEALDRLQCARTWPKRLDRARRRLQPVARVRVRDAVPAFERLAGSPCCAAADDVVSMRDGLGCQSPSNG